ncbi:DNA topoisomerase 3 [Clostridium oryzae]|uniref:DNA topoisomerase 3 n=2 Tax=Clostridium oryzae TaxID=1450648 RepID=A0A1V4IQP7_9CLOT|nr:DNA topoisomerase 3 [Clostridium oryzae]
MKTCVLAEKPSVGRDIARVLKCNKKGNGYMENEKYVVTWALGHLVTLADPEAYGEQFKSWKLEDLPILPKDMKLVVIKQTGKQFNVVKEQMNRKDVTDIVIATDAGREGELVARWIIEKIHLRKPIKRLWISSVTDKAIREGFNKLRNGKEYENLYASAVARAEADWIVGINATRALTCKYNAQLSCGRVQTPTVAMIAQREKEIKEFVPKDYYGVTIVANSLKFTWHNSKNNDTRIYDKDRCDQIASKIRGKKLKVKEVAKVDKKKYAPQLYDLTELQRDANKIFGFSAKETLSLMQRLYENHKVLTYPRTDSRYISQDVVETLKDRIKACGVGNYSKIAMKLLKENIKGSKSFVDDSKVSDHHAIIPTEESVNLSNLSSEERKIYDLVVKRFLAVMYPPFLYEQTTIIAEIDGEEFVAKGKRVISEGWKEVYGSYEDEEEENDIENQKLPLINKGDTLAADKVLENKDKTKPPAYFNEATLLSAMENPVKYMANASKDLIKTIGETGGIGTVATRADIIEKLFNTFLIEKKGKDILTTSKGRQLLELVPEDLKSPVLTAKWEQQLSQISKGSLKNQLFITDMRNYSKQIVDKIKNSDSKFRHDNITGTKCPNCGKFMLEVNSKNGKMLVCQDRECGYRKMVARVTNARCPQCHKKLELHGEGEGQIFVCKCGFREKLSTFTARKKNEGKNVGKREVAQYMKNQKKQNNEPMNSALADALAKLKLK